ncbi:hypothetical protein KSK55_03860 [Methanospirillum purgamenti]|jgi:hypothetical protein|uniref:Uncharacterized protein n=1 Tax=Methanospirillum hungatei TaxID=2203 RepID=A0A8F5ZFI2_METHU|nr:hypothetical protein [Methanospirillum hungatei]QXO95545.1 hypothetical protein KSK55_03860 [Methanospirillum hungatei]
MTYKISVSAAYDGKDLIPDQPIELKAGKKYHLIIEDIPPDTTQKEGIPDNSYGCETSELSEQILARDWLTPEEAEAWDYL